MRLIPGSPTTKLLNAALIFGPLAYLFLDCTYATRGWWDAQTGALHIVVAAVYGITAIRLVTLAEGRLQAVLLVVAMLDVGLGGNDLFQEDGPANLFKAMGFFFPLTLLLTVAAIRKRVPAWVSVLLAVGALAFPVAHVQNIAWLAILDGVILVLALGYLFTIRDRLDAPDDSPRSLPATAERVG
jgi:hypothetical protein